METNKILVVDAVANLAKLKALASKQEHIIGYLGQQHRNRLMHITRRLSATGAEDRRLPVRLLEALERYQPQPIDASDSDTIDQYSPNTAVWKRHEIR
ncbi:MAG: hypothetical protein LBF87_04030 [Treponema sp.]|jgi:hypothetical protein|nr:hypothetical protein [Treponema sp.]